MGADGKEFEANANAAEMLYSPSDLANATVKIVGDPAWIMQGSNFRIPTDEMFGGTALSTGFMPDGSIAFDNQDVLFEINWQRPEDYNLNTGLADPYSQTQKKYNNRTALQSRVYRCKKVLSEFRHGAFTQTLEGAMFYFPIPSKTNTANPAAANKSNPQGNNDGSNDRAEAARLARQGRPSSDAGAGRGTSQSAANDPRRLDIGDGGRAAILGAQNSSNNNARRSPVSNTNATNTPPGGSGVQPGQLGSGTFQILPAGSPKPATSGTGQAVGTQGTGPRKIAENTSPTSPTQPQNQNLAKD
jgi:hypothetical protein